MDKLLLDAFLVVGEGLLYGLAASIVLMTVSLWIHERKLRKTFRP
jgi:hypothetical protein